MLTNEVDDYYDLLNRVSRCLFWTIGGKYVKNDDLIKGQGINVHYNIITA